MHHELNQVAQTARPLVETFGFYKKLFFHWCAIQIHRERIDEHLILHIVAEQAFVGCRIFPRDSRAPSARILIRGPASIRKDSERTDQRSAATSRRIGTRSSSPTSTSAISAQPIAPC